MKPLQAPCVSTLAGCEVSLELFVYLQHLFISIIAQVKDEAVLFP
jgi:hypothetical protein